MKTLIIAEKPSVAADIARSIGKIPKKDDYFENEEYVVSSAVGHLVELQMPEDYDPKLRFWRLESLPIVPEKFALKPIEKTKSRFDLLKRLLNRKDVGEVINACDAGREGELIFAYTFQLAKCSKPVKRLWMSSMTQDGIREAFRHLRSSEEMEPLAQAARCRSEADWMIGINCTRAATKRLFGARAGNVAGVGRVQTPTLAIVMERERQIRAFQPRTFWRVSATFKVTQGEYVGVYQRPDFKKGDDDQDRADRIWDKQLADRVAAALHGKPTALVSEERKKATQIAPRLYDLTTLQREANNRFGFSARRTLQLAQALYERHKMITYPRTDSRALPEDYIPTCRQALSSLGGDLRGHAAVALENGWVRPDKRIFNNAQVSDHFAIIPTSESAKNLSDEEAKLFDMIARRFVAVFYPVAQFDVTTRRSEVGDFAFKTEGKVLTDPGWLAVYGKSAMDENGANLPSLDAQDGNPPKAKTVAFEQAEEQTKPPPRYTEATLLSAMEGAGKLVEDEELAEAMKEKGLGTPATRAQIIERLIDEKYIERQRRELVPTAKAETLLEFLSAVKADELTSPALTGEWEFKLRQVEERAIPADRFINGIIDMTKGVISRIKNFSEPADEARQTDWKSPTDELPMLETLRAYKSQDGKLTVYKVIGNRRMEESEIRELVEKRQIGPIDSFRSKAGKEFSAILRLNEEGKVEFVFDRNGSGPGSSLDLTGLEPIGKCPRTGGDIFETASSYVVRVVENGEEKFPFRVSRKILEREIPREQVFKLLETGKTDLLEKFWSKRTRKPFSAFLVIKPDGGTGFEFAPREPRPAKGAAKGAAKKAPAKKAASKKQAPTERAVAGEQNPDLDQI
jgi:DNA topoisomerase III